MPTIKAYPGCYLVSPIEEESTQVLIGTTAKTRILKGKIIDVGEPMEQKSGGVLKAKLNLGDTIYFLSYEGGYDCFDIGGKKVYFVLFEDGRGYEKGEEV